MNGIGTIIIVFVTGLLSLLCCRDLDHQERRYALLSFGLHIVCSFALWAIMVFYYVEGSGGDLVGYQWWGEGLARLMELDAVRYVPEVINLALHLPTHLPFEVTGDGTSTGTMSAMAGFLILVAGSSLLTMCLAASWLSWFGQLCLYRVAREEVAPVDRSRAMIGMFLVPSVIFWGAGYLKEAFVVFFFGVLVRSAWRLVRRRDVGRLVGVCVGTAGVALIKPYTLFPFVLAMAAFIYADRAWKSGGVIRIRPIYFLIVVACTIGGIALMGKIFPAFEASRLSETVARNQEIWSENHAAGAAGGSAIEMGSGDARSMSQQLAFVPVAFVNSFFRPVLFEARGGPMFGAAIENTILSLALLSLFAGSNRRKLIETVFGTPLIVFSIVFCVAFGVGVGLATANLGTLSRYRMPMMPFYVTSVLILRARGKEKVPAVATRARVLTRPSRNRAS